MMTVTKAHGVTVVKVEGDFRESFNVTDEEIKKIPSGAVEFDCSGVGDINSVGTLQWINFLKAITPRCTYSFRGCRHNFIAYARMVPLFTNDATIHSFYVPYDCEVCETRTETLHETRVVVSMKAVFHPIKCPKCGNDVVAAADPEEYASVILRED